MLKTDTEPVALGHGSARSYLIIEKTCTVIEVCDLGAFFHHIVDGSVIEVVSGKVHLFVKQGERSVHTTHPGCGNAVSTAPASHSTAHSSASTHALHHTAGHIVETSVVCIVAVQDDTDLALVSKAADHGSTLISPVVHV